MRYQLQVDSEYLNNNTVLIHLSGDINEYADQEIQKMYDTVTKRGASNIIFQLAEDNIVQSSGISILINVIINSRKRNQHIVMVLANKHLQRIFNLVGITQYVEIFDTVDHAKDHLKQMSPIFA